MDAVAILSCRKAAETCGGVDCLGFFHRRERSFSGRGDREMRLAAFATCNGCECDPASDEAFQKKLDKLSGAGVEEVHVAACVTEGGDPDGAVRPRPAGLPAGGTGLKRSKGAPGGSLGAPLCLERSMDSAAGRDCFLRRRMV